MQRERANPATQASTGLGSGLGRASSGIPLQRKLTIGASDDPLEKEADRIADQVMSMPANPSTATAPLQIQRFTRQPTGSAGIAPPSVHRVLASPGTPLEPGLRQDMESRFGYDFSNVRVHSGEAAEQSAAEVNASAYTVGDNIVFGAEQYYSNARAEKHLLAHELTHTLQQRGAPNYTKLTDLSERIRDRAAEPIEPAYKPKGNHSSIIQRKLLLHSEEDRAAFAWYLTKNDATNFSYSGKKGGRVEVFMKSPASAKIEDAFRLNILKHIINAPNEQLIIQKYGFTEPLPAHPFFIKGKFFKQARNTNIANESRSAGGLTIPSQSLALKAENDYTGNVTGVTNESWIFYVQPSNLAHEFGHAFLAFSGAPSAHSKFISKSIGILTPEGKPFEGTTDEFIKNFVEEKFGNELYRKKFHFSPTSVRTWPEPPNYKTVFTGTWLQFLAKYPGSSFRVGKQGKLKVCGPEIHEQCL